MILPKKGGELTRKSGGVTIKSGEVTTKFPVSNRKELNFVSKLAYCSEAVVFCVLHREYTAFEIFLISWLAFYYDFNREFKILSRNFLWLPRLRADCLLNPPGWAP